MVSIIARITARAGGERQLRAVVQDLIGSRRPEAGCVSYDLFQNEHDPLEVVTVEQWSDQAAADAHLATPHVATAITLASELLAQAPLIHRFTPVVG